MQNAHQIDQMLADLTRVDFANVREQAMWVCPHCDPAVVVTFEAQFQTNLEEHKSLEEWAGWLQAVVHTQLNGYGHDRMWVLVSAMLTHASSFSRLSQ